jgi:hypothetical protein
VLGGRSKTLDGLATATRVVVVLALEQRYCTRKDGSRPEEEKALKPARVTTAPSFLLSAT